MATATNLNKTHLSPSADYFLFVDESGDRSLNNVDKNWPILSIFGALFSRNTYFSLCKKIDALKMDIWSPLGLFEYKDGLKEVCFHSRDMRYKKGPFAPSIISEEQRSKMDNGIWDDIFTALPWKGVASVICKDRLIDNYANPSDPYNLAVTYMIERVIYNTTGRVQIIFEARGRNEDRDLRKHISYIKDFGTGYLDAKRINNCIEDYIWVPKFNSIFTEPGLEIADLGAYAIGSFVCRQKMTPYAEKVLSKLFGANGLTDIARIMGKGLKVFP